MNDQPQALRVPTIEQLTQAITTMIMQRSQAKDQIDQIEKQLPVLQGQLQLLNAIEAANTVVPLNPE